MLALLPPPVTTSTCKRPVFAVARTLPSLVAVATRCVPVPAVPAPVWTVMPFTWATLTEPPPPPLEAACTKVAVTTPLADPEL
jgi:hypothetical protein